MADCEAVGRKLDPKINRIAQTPCRLLPNAATRNSREQEGRLLPTLLFNLLFFRSSRPGTENLLSVRCMRSSFVESTDTIPLGNRKGKRPCPMPPGHCVKTLPLSLSLSLVSSPLLDGSISFARPLAFIVPDRRLPNRTDGTENTTEEILTNDARPNRHLT